MSQWIKLSEWGCVWSFLTTNKKMLPISISNDIYISINYYSTIFMSNKSQSPLVRNFWILLQCFMGVSSDVTYLSNFMQISFKDMMHG